MVPDVVVCAAGGLVVEAPGVRGIRVGAHEAEEAGGQHQQRRRPRHSTKFTRALRRARSLSLRLRSPTNAKKQKADGRATPPLRPLPRPARRHTEQRCAQRFFSCSAEQKNSQRGKIAF